MPFSPWIKYHLCGLSLSHFFENKVRVQQAKVLFAPGNKKNGESASVRSQVRPKSVFFSDFSSSPTETLFIPLLHYTSCHFFPHFTFFSCYFPNLYLSPTLALLPFLLSSPPPASSQSSFLPPIVPYTGLEPLQDVINKSCRAERRRRPRIRFGARLPPAPLRLDRRAEI